MCTTVNVKRGVFTATVAGNERLCEEHFRLRLRVAGFPPSRPGQFVQLQCRPPVEQPGAVVVDWPDGRPPKFTQAELTDKEPLLRRPFSLAGRRDVGGAAELDIIYRTIGTGTHWLFGVAAGQELSLLGPLGNHLPVVTGKPRAALVGGGVGIPPMLYLAEALRRAGKETIAFCGARRRELLPLRPGSQKADANGKPSLCSAEFEEHDVSCAVSTDDGSLGQRGFVTDAFGNWLQAAGAANGDLVVYACGPEIMMRRVGEICLQRGVECYLSLERHMACGMGTCQSCVVKIRDESGPGWSYKLCCTDGPVFEAGRIVWDG